MHHPAHSQAHTQPCCQGHPAGAEEARGLEMQPGCNLLPSTGSPRVWACTARSTCCPCRSHLLLEPPGRALTPQGLLSPQTGPEPGQAVPQAACGLPLKDAVGCASFKEPNISGSPDPKAWRRLIKDIRQYDSKNRRTALICAKRSQCAAFSGPPYREGCGSVT